MLEVQFSKTNLKLLFPLTPHEKNLAFVTTNKMHFKEPCHY